MNRGGEPKLLEALKVLTASLRAAARLTAEGENHHAFKLKEKKKKKSKKMKKSSQQF